MISRLALVAGVLAMRMAAQGVTVVNGASFRPELTPGSWATAVGNFGTVAATTAAAFPIPQTLNGVSITVGGIPAPIYYVSGTQINFLIPYSTGTGIRPVRVVTAAGNFDGTAKVMSTAPGVFVQDTAIPPKGAIRNQDSSLNTSSAPARRGDVIQIFGTGPGTLDSLPADGTAVGSNPLVRSASTPQVYIGGIEATVQFSGLTPGQTSLWQVNAIVPAQGFITGRVPVQVFMDGVNSNEVTVFVQ
jgi:uncharacterized protein (TIGR03437 family)